MNPYSAPVSATVAASEDDRITRLGGINRLPYFLGGLGLGVVGLIPILGLLAQLVGLPILAWHRMKQVGYHPALGLLILIPLVNIWPGVICLAAPKGYRYTRKLDTAGKVIIGLLVGFLALVILLVVFGVFASRH